MKSSLNNDTLAFQLGVRPAFQIRDMSWVLTTQVSKAINPVLKAVHNGGASKKANPEQDAIMFYLLNHATSVVSQKVDSFESLGEYLPIVEAYSSSLNVMATRMFYYLLLICTRESRHAKDGYQTGTWKAINNTYGCDFQEFHKTIKGGGSSSAVVAFLDMLQEIPLGNYTRALCDLFNKGSYTSGYGGKAWGKVSEVLRDFVTGKISAEVMMDTAFTLCHNNGPIFNKGMLFDNYSPEIYKILDVQRSGQIPQLVGNSETKWASNYEVKALWEQCQSVLGASFEGHVDWYKVEALGALKSYPTEKKNQAKLYGVVVQPTVQQAVPVKSPTDKIFIMPGFSVKKVQVPR